MGVKSAGRAVGAGDGDETRFTTENAENAEEKQEHVSRRDAEAQRKAKSSYQSTEEHSGRARRTFSVRPYREDAEPRR